MDFAHGRQGLSSSSRHDHAQQQHMEEVELSIEVGGWAREAEREHMFDKVVTPSDVGKLNRLVIPKQHAEKYFPLDDDNNKNKQVGVFLNFEDRQGKSWRFRYSYWNSSQSYVMTKGWSRFVKDKNLDAGDLVSFLRHKLHPNSFFIDWRRRPHPLPPDHHHHAAFSAPWTPLLTHWNWITTTPHLFTNYNYNNLLNIRNHHRIGRPDQESNNNMELSLPVTTTTVQSGAGAGKKLRLFGVNMEMEQSTSSSSNHDKGKPQSSNSSFMSLDFHT